MNNERVISRDSSARVNSAIADHSDTDQKLSTASSAMQRIKPERETNIHSNASLSPDLLIAPTHIKKGEMGKSIGSTRYQAEADTVKSPPLQEHVHSKGDDSSQAIKENVLIGSLTSDILSFESVSVAEENRTSMTPNELIRVLQQVTRGEPPGFLHEGSELKRRPSLTLEELTDVLCHINTAEACAREIRWDIISNLVQPLDADHFHLESYQQYHDTEDLLPAPISEIEFEVESDSLAASLSSLSMDGHDLVDDRNWESSTTFSQFDFG